MNNEIEIHQNRPQSENRLSMYFKLPKTEKQETCYKLINKNE